jgi:hypothetical protein
VCLTVEMPLGVGHGMRMLVARDVDVGRERTHAVKPGLMDAQAFGRSRDLAGK